MKAFDPRLTSHVVEQGELPEAVTGAERRHNPLGGLSVQGGHPRWRFPSKTWPFKELFKAL